MSATACAARASRRPRLRSARATAWPRSARGHLRRPSPARVRVRLGAAALEIDNAAARDGEAAGAVRPEAIAVELAPGPAGALAGTITKSSYLGTHMEYSIDTAAGTLF